MQKYIEEGKLVAVECTAMNAGKDLNYDDAKGIANRTIQMLVEKNVTDHECIDVQIVRSIGVRPLPMRVRHPDFTDKMIEDALTALKNLMPEGKTSMLQDVEAKRKTEVEMLAGTIIELGKKHNISTPYNTVMYEMIKSIETNY